MTPFETIAWSMENQTEVWIIVMFIISLGLILRAVTKAPRGYQNSTGFHFGDPDDNEPEDM